MNRQDSNRVRRRRPQTGRTGAGGARRLAVAAILACALVNPVVATAATEIIARGESAGMAYRVEQVGEGLGVPWGMDFVDPDRLLISERRGRLQLLDIRDAGVRPVSGAPRVRAAGQGGLLDVAVDPDGSGWIYLTYSKPVEGKAATALARARLQGERLVDVQDLLVTRSVTDTGRHFGSRVTFDGRGHLFFGVGDRGERPNGQDLQTHAGSVLRLRMDGSVPADNPFTGRSDALDEIWSYGHRNPQGLVWDRATDRLWEIEHGPRGGDEINLVRRGANYGWAVLSYGKEYWGPFDVGEGTEREGMVQPVKVYVPSIAPGSLMVYAGDAFPAWRGNLFSGALKLTHLNRVVVDANGEAVDEERLLNSLGERIRALRQGPDGFIYLSTDSGRILRIRPD